MGLRQRWGRMTYIIDCCLEYICVSVPDGIWARYVVHVWLTVLIASALLLPGQQSNMCTPYQSRSRLHYVAPQRRTATALQQGTSNVLKQKYTHPSNAMLPPKEHSSQGTWVWRGVVSQKITKPSERSNGKVMVIVGCQSAAILLSSSFPILRVTTDKLAVPI